MKKVFIILTYICLAAVIAAAGIMRHEKDNAPGYLEISQESGNYYYDGIRDIRISGFDADGVTYFLLPSYITDDRIEQVTETVRIYLSDGSLLDRANFGEIQDILVDFGSGEKIPWKMCFMKSSNLYSAFISLDDGADITSLTREAYAGASITIYDPKGMRNYSDNDIEIKGRGNYSWQPDKKPLEMRLAEKSSLCGLEPSKKWALLSDYFDPTMIMNKLALDLASELGVEHISDCDWVDVYVGTEYMGNYLICKEPGDTAYDEACLFRKEIPHTYDKKPYKFMSGNLRFVIDLPDEAGTEQMDAVKAVVDDADKSIRNGDYDSCIDKDSFIKRFLIEEFFFNADALSHSYYFFMHPGESRIYAGPCWDYDLAGGNFYGAFGLYYDPEMSILDMTDYPEYAADKVEWLDWDKVLFDYPAYRETAHGIFAENMDLFDGVVYDKIDMAYDKVQASVRMDYVRWPDKERHYRDYDNEIRHLKFFMSERLGHMENLLGIDNETVAIELNKNEYHDVKFVSYDGEELVIKVPDGTCIGEDELPWQADEYTIWVNTVSNESLFSPFFPIYEDTEYGLVDNTYES